MFEPSDLGTPITGDLFLPKQPKGTTGLARRLDPARYYIAMRWDYRITPRGKLRKMVVLISANGLTIKARPVDWGPNVRTGRVMDISPGAASALGLSTDDTATATYEA